MILRRLCDFLFSLSIGCDEIVEDVSLVAYAPDACRSMRRFCPSAPGAVGRVHEAGDDGQSPQEIDHRDHVAPGAVEAASGLL